MSQDSVILLVAACAIAISFQVISIYRIETLVRRTGGRIRSRTDLAEVKSVINLNMVLALAYIALDIVLLVLVVKKFVSGQPFQAAAILFLFGIITLPVGLIAKGFERKIRSMQVDPPDEQVKSTFERYLVQWKQARFRLPD